MSDGDGAASATWATIDGVVAASHGPAVIDAEAHADDGRVRLRVRPEGRAESSLSGEVDLEPHDLRTLADAVDPEVGRPGAVVPATRVADGADTWVSVSRFGGRLRFCVDSDRGSSVIDADSRCRRQEVVATLRAVVGWRAREVIDS